MKAIIERVDTNRGHSAKMNWIEQAEVSAEDAEEYGPIAYGTKSNAHVFESFAEAGAWVDEHTVGYLRFAVWPLVERIR